MKKSSSRKTEIQLQLNDIVSKLEGIDDMLDDVLRRLAPNERKSLPSQIVAQREPEYKPSSHHASLAARSHEQSQVVG